jgi:hypothetical protein
VHSAQEQRRDHFAMVSTRPPIAAQHVISVFRRPSLSTPASASGIIGQHNMGAENSKPSTEVTQHVFSPYVRLRRPNGQHAMLQTRHD